MIREARRDAAALYREFRCAIGREGLDRVTERWADLRSDFKLCCPTTPIDFA
jgi:hypothetical protein